MSQEDKEFFPGQISSHDGGNLCSVMAYCTIAGIGRIRYEPDAPAEEVMCFRHYNAEEVSSYYSQSVDTRGKTVVLISGDNGKANGGVAEVLCLFLAHLQGHW